MSTQNQQSKQIFRERVRIVWLPFIRICLAQSPEGDPCLFVRLGGSKRRGLWGAWGVRRD